MTKVQVHYDLVRPLGDEDAEGVSKIHGVYGIMRVYLAPTLDRVTVDYDASRMSEKEVETALIASGVPVRREPVIASEA